MRMRNSWIRQVKQVGQGFLYVGVVGLLIVIGINLYIIGSTHKQVLSLEEYVTSTYNQADIPILVLGAGVINNAEPSQVLQKRLETAEAIFRLGSNQAYIMSGDHRADNYNEVAVMKQYLIQQGIPSRQIYLDHAGYSTYESLYRLKEVLGQKKAIIVTQGYHLSRALLIANHLGIDAVGINAAEVSSTRFNRELREVVARLKEFAVVYLGYQDKLPESNYAFDLKESGDLTNHKEALVRK